MSAFQRTFRLLRSYQRVAFNKRSASGGINYNRGVLSHRERGDRFTEPGVYRSTRNISAQIKVQRKEKFLWQQERHRQRLGAFNINCQAEEELCTGRRVPLTANEVKASRAIDEAELVDGMHSREADYTPGLNALLKHEAERREHLLDKFGQPPSSREFYGLFRKLRAADDAEGEVEKHQKRLVEENGVYPSTRMDAFMLDDETYFPAWVQALPYAIRDRVKYGSLGLTEEDEALRVRLGRLPRDKRLKEWKRLKAAKEYRAAHEETLTLAELRDARQGKRRFHWLQRKRQRRAATLRRMALRKPEGYEEWPSSVVDYSQRVAFIAQHVENGLQTSGQWPLDPHSLTQAKIKRRQEAAERTFLTSPDEKKLIKKPSISGSIQELLASFDNPEKPYKRLSRKVYANRVNAVVHGDQDEYGRRHRKMHGLATRRVRAFESLAEMGLEKEIRSEPRINVGGLNHADDEHWTKHYKSWSDGLPSTRMNLNEPRKRCAVAIKDGLQHLFLVVPKPQPPPSREIESLMVFDDAPKAVEEPPAASQAGDTITSDVYAPGSAWRYGSMTIPIMVNSNGDLRRATQFGETEFDSLQDAYQHCGPFDAITEYYTLFGCMLLDKVYFLAATQVERSVALPFSGFIYKVLGTKWISFVLPGVAPLKISLTDRERLQEFCEYSHFKGYYYSDDVDLRLQFPFIPTRDTSMSPNFYCDWSEHLRQPFQSASLRVACSVLIRGFCGESVCSLKDGSELHMVLLGRQNNLNPGPRYLGRGLNTLNAAGNDHIYEYIIWKSHSDVAATFARHTILRGTVPVHWSTRLSMSLAEPAMIFNHDKAEVLKGCENYFTSLFQNLQKMINVDSVDFHQTPRNPQVRCVNLLRQNAQQDEGKLSRYLIESVRMAEPCVKRLFPHSHLDVVHVDWLSLIREYTLDVAVSSFWEAVMSFLAKSNKTDNAMMTVGIMQADGCVTRLIAQSRFLRVNCADSLDRTNLGCFFSCLQVTIAMLETLQISPNSFSDESPLPPLSSATDGSSAVAFGAAYVPVSGAKRAVPKPFLSTWEEARSLKSLPPAVARALAELFVYNGDCVAMLYTNSLAMHGNILRGICGMRPARNNAVIATQRKYENVFEDRTKFRSIELLLGRNRDVHFPSMSDSFLTRPMPYDQWACALTVVGIPPGTRAADIDAAVRNAWDTRVVPRLLETNQPPIESSALCLNITLQEDDWEDLHAAFAAAVGQLSFDAGSAQEATGDDETLLVTNSVKIAIIEFDPSLCCAIDAPLLLRKEGFISLKGHNAVLAPYSYPVQEGIEAGGVGSAVKNVGTTFKRGIKNLFRNLHQ